MHSVGAWFKYFMVNNVSILQKLRPRLPKSAALDHLFIFLPECQRPVACFEKSGPCVMKVFSHFGEETIDGYEVAEVTQAGADRGEAA